MPKAWIAICSRRKQQYPPRWTFPILYFRMPIARQFGGATGLDVGARVSPSIRSALKLLVPPGHEPDNFTECFVPHHLYYTDVGCSMEAIDIIVSSKDTLIKYGDARMLAHASESFDFITVPMLLGSHNVCATPIEIALCVRSSPVFWDLAASFTSPTQVLSLVSYMPRSSPATIAISLKAGLRVYLSAQCLGESASVNRPIGLIPFTKHLRIPALHCPMRGTKPSGLRTYSRTRTCLGLKVLLNEVGELQEVKRVLAEMYAKMPCSVCHRSEYRARFCRTCRNDKETLHAACSWNRDL